MTPQVGLYLSVKGNHLFHRTIVTTEKTTQFPDTTITAEVLRLSELDITDVEAMTDMMAQRFRQAHRRIWDPSDAHWHYDVEKATLEDLIAWLYRCIAAYESEHPFDGALLTVLADHRLRNWFGGMNISIGSVDMLIYLLQEACGFSVELRKALALMEHGTPQDLSLLDPDFLRTQHSQILTFDGAIHTTYQFCTIGEYYSFLLMHFMAEDRRVLQCQHCGKFFIPKTKRRTLYCDRVSPDGRTCKDLGPVQKHKRLAATDTVVEAFDRNMRKLHKRCQRAADARNGYPAQDAYDSYYAWLDQAQQAKAAYLSGQLSAEKALEIICVDEPHQFTKP
jgi:hypothetical protein